MAPDGYVFGIVRGIGAVFLGTGGAEDGNNRNIDRRGQVHGAAIIADEEGALFKLGRQLSQAGFAGEVDHSTLLRAQCVFELLIESDVTWSTYEEDLWQVPGSVSRASVWRSNPYQGCCHHR